jgi:hypothetical protein
MEITEEQYERIKDALPVQRGNVRLSNLQVLNAVRPEPCHQIRAKYNHKPDEAAILLVRFTRVV